MDDNSIVRLYLDRSDTAISETQKKYGGYCTKIALNILATREDAEECVNDTYLGAWNSIPPHMPQRLSTFLGKITRNLAFNKVKHDGAKKRGSGELILVLDELEDVVSGSESVEDEAQRRELVRAIDAFLAELPETKRNVFVCRYWYADSVSDIAKRYGLTAANVSVMLGRLRKSLRDYLTERSIEV